MIQFRTLLLILSLIFLNACTHFGAMNLPPDRIRYNKSIINSDLQQALLNLVRLRYGDSPNFLSVSSIVSQFSIDGSISSDPYRNYGPLGMFSQIDLGVRGAFSERPTVTYTPMQGEEFVTRLLTPVDIKIFKLLLRDGWGIGRVFRTFIQKLDNMDNAVIASRPLSHRIPQYKAFSEFTKILRDLQIHYHILIHSDTDLDYYRLRFEVTSFKGLSASQMRGLAHHGITPSHPVFWISSEDHHLPHNFYAETRTVLAIYSYLSKGVQVPRAHEDIVKPLKLPNGENFDWNEVIGGLIKVKASKTQPNKAYICIFYRGYYFYLDDRDVESKESMNMLMMLNGIFQGNIQSVLPVFTVN